MLPPPTNAESEHDADIQPVPPRWRWLKLGALAFALFLIAFIFLYVGWSRHAENRLQAAIDRIIAREEPLFPEDFNSPPIPDDENAALLYEKAAKLIADSGVDKSPAYRKCHGLSENDEGFISTCGSMVLAHENALALVRQARFLPRASWSIEIKSPLLEQKMPPFGDLRTLIKLLKLKARLAHLSHADLEAIDSLEDILAMSVANELAPSLISHLVAVSAEAVAADIVEAMASDLAIENAEVHTAKLPVDRERVKSLIRRLLDDESLNTGLIRALQFERAMPFDVVLNFASDLQTVGGDFGVSAELSPWSSVPLPLGSLCKLDAAAALEQMTHQVSAAQSATFVGYNRHLNSLPTPRWMQPGNLLERLHNVFSRMLTPSLSRAAQLHYRVLADRRMAATALAIRIYEVDHGHRPTILDTLVPEYLPVIPKDPFSSNGVFQYMPDAEYPRLYSVGPDGVDDGGEFAFKRGGVIDLDALDMAFFLDGQPPPPSNDDGEPSPP